MPPTAAVSDFRRAMTPAMGCHQSAVRWQVHERLAPSDQRQAGCRSPQDSRLGRGPVTLGRSGVADNRSVGMRFRDSTLRSDGQSAEILDSRF